jgi:hypothetical protein
MAGLVPAMTPSSCRFPRRKAAYFQALSGKPKQLRRMDGRDKPGHDGGWCFRRLAQDLVFPAPPRESSPAPAKSRRIDIKICLYLYCAIPADLLSVARFNR